MDPHGIRAMGIRVPDATEEAPAGSVHPSAEPIPLFLRIGLTPTVAPGYTDVAITLAEQIRATRKGTRMPQIFVDADACPVKDEVYRVARRHGLRVTLAAAQWMRIPVDDAFTLEVVGSDPDAADDWIVEHVGEDDIVITADIHMAARCLEKGAHVLGNTGNPFTQDNIGSALATRDLLAELRETGDVGGGPPPFRKRDRSRFLQRLEEAVTAVQRRS